jgi:hypothetical protein
MARMDFAIDVPIAKVDTDQRLAFGWASVTVDVDGSPLVDKDGDVIDVQELEKAAYRYVMGSRDGGVNHQRRGVAKLVESFVVTPEKLVKMGLSPYAVPAGWWVGFQFNDEDVWQGVKSGEFGMLSVHGTGVRSDAD